MPYLVGNATSSLDFYNRLKSFVLGRGFLGQVSFSGAGNGKLIDFRCLDLNNADEVYTIVCETSLAQSGGFDVLSSLRGNLFDTLVNQVYQDTRVQFYIDFDTIDFAPGDTFTLKFIDYVGAKARFSSVTPWTEAKTEVITLTCTTAGVAEVAGVQNWLPAEFSVAGSVTGGMGSYSQGTPFGGDVVRFILDAGDKVSPGAQFQVGDVLRIYTTRNPLREINQHWETLRELTDANGNDTQWIFKGRGWSGDDEIFLGITSRYNLAAMRGYLPGMTFDEQPGVLPSSRRPVLATYTSASGLPYWISVDGRSIRTKVRNNTYYHDTYMGLGIPWGSPKHQAYFPVVGGGRTSALSANVENCNYWNALTSSSSGNYRDYSPLQFMDRDGVWRGAICHETANSNMATTEGYTLWPTHANKMSLVARNIDGSRALMPFCILPTFGELDKVFATNSLSYGSQPEDILWNPTTRKKYIVTPDTYKTSPFQAMELS